MSNQTLFIHRIESKYSAEYIANTLWNQNLAQVSSIVLVPIVSSDFTYQRAYIKIENWCDSETAYNFIRRLNNITIETRIVHADDNWWPVQQLNFNINFNPIYDDVVTFEPEYFAKHEEEDEEYTEDEEYAEDEVNLKEIEDFLKIEDGIQWAINNSQNVTRRHNQILYVF
jgi:hypothetical protein